MTKKIKYISQEEKMPEQTIMELRILDTEFNLKAKGNEEHIKHVSDYVNAELERVKAANPFSNHIRIAILGCMNITERLFNAEEEVRNNEEAKAKEIGTIKQVKEELKKTNDMLTEEKAKYDSLAEEKELLQKELDEKNLSVLVKLSGNDLKDLKTSFGSYNIRDEYFGLQREIYR